jgi:hypothetical protein
VQFDNAWKFSEGLAAVEIIQADGTPRAGFINPAGEFVIEPQFLKVGNFSEGLAGAMFQEGGSPLGYGIIDQSGATVLEPQFFSYYGTEPPTFRNGLALVEIEGGKAYINHAGEVLFGPFGY